MAKQKTENTSDNPNKEMDSEKKSENIEEEKSSDTEKEKNEENAPLYPDLQKYKVYPQLLYLKLKEWFLQAILWSAIFLPIPLFYLKDLTALQTRYLILTYIAIIIFAIISIDMYNRSTIITEKKRKFSVIFVISTIIYAILILVIIYWYFSWQNKSFPILDELL